MHIKKIVSIFLIALLLISGGVIVAAEGDSAEGITTSSCVNDTRIVTISGGSNQPERTKATLMVFYPNKTIADLATTPINQVVAYADEQGVNAEGDFNFSFTLKADAPSGVYTVWVSLPGNPVFNSTFIYSDVALAASALTDIQDTSKTAADIVTTLDATALAIDVMIGQRYNQHSEEQKLGVAAYLAANRPTDGPDLKTKFEDIVLTIDAIANVAGGNREKMKEQIEDVNNPMMLSGAALAAYGALTPDQKDNLVVLLSADAENLIYPEHVSAAIIAAAVTVTQPAPTTVPSLPITDGNNKIIGVSGSYLEQNSGLKTDIAAQDSFADLNSVQWAKNAINIIAARGIINGRGDGNYYPNDPVKREEFVKILISAFGLRMTSQNTLPFKDVAPQDWCYEVIGIAKESGIVGGMSEEFFGKGMPISRQDMAVMLANTLNHVGSTIAKTEGAESSYTDEASIAEYAKEAVANLSENEILTGRGDGTFDPLATTSRAEVATVIYRIMYKLNLL